MPPKRGLSCCLDANLSYRVAESLRMVGYEIAHVSEWFPGSDRPGVCEARDEDIAHECGSRNYVLITCDKDFHTRWVTTGVLADAGVEVIVFKNELAGLRHQHDQVTTLWRHWETSLCSSEYSHRVWEQGAKGPPVQRRSQRKRPPTA